MTIWWMIFWSGIGTYLLRSAGAWMNPQWFRAKWLVYLPFAVILVMAASSVSSFLSTSGGWTTPIAAIAATAAVVAASLKKLPLIACIAIGCVVFGAIAG